jgi:hypothetical protein
MLFRKTAALSFVQCTVVPGALITATKALHLILGLSAQQTRKESTSQ